MVWRSRGRGARTRTVLLVVDALHVIAHAVYVEEEFDDPHALIGAGTKSPDEHVLTPDLVVQLLASGGLQVKGGWPAPSTSEVS
jgi:hypothetical protein